MAFRERDVSRDPAAAQDLVARSGQMGVPVTLVEDPARPAAAEVIVGFDRARLEAAANRVAAAGRGSGARSAGGAAGAPPRLGLLARGVEGGVEIGGVRPGSLAERAGLRAGDLVLAIDGRPVRSSADIEAAAQLLAGGAGLDVVLQRDGQRVRTRLGE